MRNELVVSLFLYIGLSSGNIVPTSIIESDSLQEKQMDKILNKINLPTTNRAILSYVRKTKSNHKLDLQDQRNTIKYSEILSQGVESPNNISGRSFIFIRQKFKSPMLNLFHSQMLNPADIAQESVKSVMANIDTEKFEEISRRFSTLNTVTPANEKLRIDTISKALDKSQGALLSQLCYSRLKLENDGMVKKIKDNIKIPDEENISNERRDYLELLKPPLLRQNFKDSDVQPLSVQENESLLVDVSKAPYLRNHDSFAKMSLDLRQNLVKKYNKDHRPNNYKVGYSKNDNQHELHEATYNFNDNIGLKIFEENASNDKGINNYLKNTLEGKLKEKKKPVQVNRIHYCHDCSSKNVNNDVYQRKRIEADCKCGRHVYFKGRSDWEEQEKQMRSLSIISTDRQLITARIGDKHSKENQNMIDFEIAKNPHFY